MEKNTERCMERERSTLSGSDPPSPCCTQDPEPLFPPFFAASIIHMVLHSLTWACMWLPGPRLRLHFEQICLGLFDYLCDWHRTAGRTLRTPQTDGKNKPAYTELMRRTLQRRYPVWTVSSFFNPVTVSELFCLFVHLIMILHICCYSDMEKCPLSRRS